LKLASNLPWYDLPSRYPPYQTCYRRYRQWQRSGLLDQLLRVIYQDLRTRGGLDLQQAFQNGEIGFVRQGNRGAFHCAPHLRDTWQFYTALIFLGIGEKLRRTAPYQTNRFARFA
jgi:transposase